MGTTSRPVPVSGGGRLEEEHRNQPLGPALVVRVVGERRDRALPPLGTLVTVELARDHLLLLRAVLHLDARIGAQVGDPVRMRRGAALRPDREIAAVVLDAHQWRLAQLAAADTPVRDDDDRAPGVAQRRRLGATGGLVSLDLFADPVDGARLVLTV